ncbi:TPA: hypothetical protein NGT07_004944 [Vibrio parahaemolyticus]|uniref:hypothetical protein n=1 Tax=Vibrio parahaemolyticus TaxID=670 RepID=UPI00111F2C8F|nr:hypothetical protein [Vibrio parahaemolyticus]TOF05953.1 hypothetical protein CGJ29_18460 [Vibrio parahaemolyticus]TOI28217.1 hypothetical protein CGI63_22740 [Vibrio parahaemolyticus]TOM55337.1 hypothetical protein CGH74_23370 [Vibrio parahaemolyticus]HCE4654325.1 hypothetical protein [Vibrio parahaemolyticus]HCE4659019.1 hypothetical protein [Vibrio parahaemolyticus]
MQINLNHVQRDTSNRWLLSAVLDAIQYQAPEAFQASCRVAGGLNTWLDEEELEILLSAHSNELEQVQRQAEYEKRKRTKEQSQVLYAYDKANDDLKFAVGRTTLDREQMTITDSQFKNWVQRQLERKDITVSQREDLLAANYWLAKAQTIIIKNGF